ncbi:hypothetical protein BDV96DRAFT_630767 [Lophiotrema nucula]|uniref:Uncharacterized protein n=1 Tax=Lophiotrema nucula TaxID=690887 RepID=A0A6A5ZDN7_9PLEO|nr:hypothetical protein BDV96DRAFT_630767 [Lophiotrema nucula]
MSSMVSYKDALVGPSSPTSKPVLAASSTSPAGAARSSKIAAHRTVLPRDIVEADEPRVKMSSGPSSFLPASSPWSGSTKSYACVLQFAGVAQQPSVVGPAVSMPPIPTVVTPRKTLAPAIPRKLEKKTAQRPVKLNIAVGATEPPVLLPKHAPKTSDAVKSLRFTSPSEVDLPENASTHAEAGGADKGADTEMAPKKSNLKKVPNDKTEQRSNDSRDESFRTSATRVSTTTNLPTEEFPYLPPTSSPVQKAPKKPKRKSTKRKAAFEDVKRPLDYASLVGSTNAAMDSTLAGDEPLSLASNLVTQCDVPTDTQLEAELGSQEVSSRTPKNVEDLAIEFEKVPEYFKDPNSVGNKDNGKPGHTPVNDEPALEQGIAKSSKGKSTSPVLEAVAIMVRDMEKDEVAVVQEDSVSIPDGHTMMDLGPGATMGAIANESQPTIPSLDSTKATGTQREDAGALTICKKDHATGTMEQESPTQVRSSSTWSGKMTSLDDNDVSQPLLHGHTKQEALDLGIEPEVYDKLLAEEQKSSACHKACLDIQDTIAMSEGSFPPRTDPSYYELAKARAERVADEMEKQHLLYPSFDRESYMELQLGCCSAVGFRSSEDQQIVDGIEEEFAALEICTPPAHRRRHSVSLDSPLQKEVGNIFASKNLAVSEAPAILSTQASPTSSQSGSRRSSRFADDWARAESPISSDEEACYDQQCSSKAIARTGAVLDKLDRMSTTDLIQPYMMTPSLTRSAPIDPATAQQGTSPSRSTSTSPANMEDWVRGKIYASMESETTSDVEITGPVSSPAHSMATSPATIEDRVRGKIHASTLPGEIAETDVAGQNSPPSQFAIHSQSTIDDWVRGKIHASMTPNIAATYGYHYHSPPYPPCPGFPFYGITYPPPHYAAPCYYPPSPYHAGTPSPDSVRAYSNFEPHRSLTLVQCCPMWEEPHDCTLPSWMRSNAPNND